MKEKLKDFAKKHPIVSVIGSGLGIGAVAVAGYWGGPAGAELAQRILTAIFGG